MNKGYHGKQDAKDIIYYFYDNPNNYFVTIQCAPGKVTEPMQIDAKNSTEKYSIFRV